MTTFILIVGYVFSTVVATTALLWLWEVTLRKIWRHCVNNKEFLDVVIRYAKEKRAKKVAGNSE